MDKALEEIVSKFKEIELQESNNKLAEKERETATEMRNACLETFSETNKRKGDQTSNNTRRKRRSTDDTLKYLREKMEIDRTLRERELQIAEQREQTVQNLLTQQQQQNQLMFNFILQQRNGSNNGDYFTHHQN